MSSDAGWRIEISGRVQGVGFRPHVWRTAVALGVSGRVSNTGNGVQIDLFCSESKQHEFCQRLLLSLPPLACVDKITTLALKRGRVAKAGGFLIEPSPVQSSDNRISVPADLAPCDSCRAELFDPDSRRYRYPFISCTQCGPRLSILHALPYDRARTAMSMFPLCRNCAGEYENPADRRFHAETNACVACGPELWLEDARGQVAAAQDPFEDMARVIAAGGIVAIKGAGGFHLCCDARRANAVARLRTGKQRPHKPLAVMFEDIEQARACAHITTQQAETMSAAEAPVVLCRARPDSPLARNVAADVAWLGCMLPSTPVHLLLMVAVQRPLVMTSGNVSGAPTLIDNDAARALLLPWVDLLVLHDRPIVHRLDDAVVYQDDGAVELIRPGRGMVPVILPLPPGFRTDLPWLAVGGDLKNTFSFVQGGQLVLGTHQGDMQALAAYRAAASSGRDWMGLLRLRPVGVSRDCHPDYHSTRLADGLAGESMHSVQHHHAHMAACLFEHGHPLHAEPVLALCLDGLGYGQTGTLWGGECLYGSYSHVRRLGGLRPMPMPGADAAARQPWRMLVACLYQAQIEIESLKALWPWMGTARTQALQRMIETGIQSPLCSSAGRLFDAVAAALGCYAEGISHEGQAAMALEALAWEALEMQSDDVHHTGGRYAMQLTMTEGGWQLDASPLWPLLIEDLRAGCDRREVALRFHRSLVAGLLQLVQTIGTEQPFEKVVLTGGVMQNRLLRTWLRQALAAAGFEALCHHRVPCNDAGLSVGQAAVALARHQDKQHA
ncbi:carbamoyltransferase HypF [Marinobacterium weihaiense]|uniref:Carbamoyltransferase HypF n=1 Tax=Marinobacterium weihaiense TaxID=2851016 RepID=A0ABS6M6J6_9GAMM|nr:carbamoyltransferase HypF [Marinobacterium weihaiense]MBV0931897.1 carbamoyltransferase HypF [Marinobacterium weihaiense]